MAATSTSGSLQDLIIGVGGFINDILIPLVLGIAFLVFIVNVVRYFIIESSSEEGQTNAKSLALYSVSAFVFILSFWGIVNLIAGGIGLNNGNCIDGNAIQSDYFSNKSSCSGSSVGAAGGPIPTEPTVPTGSIGPVGGPIPSIPTDSTGAAGGPIPTTSFDVNGNPITTALPKIAGISPVTLGKSITYSIPKDTPITPVVSGTIVVTTKITGTNGNPDLYQIVIKENNGNFVQMINIKAGSQIPQVGQPVLAGVDILGYGADPIPNTNANVVVNAFNGSAGKTFGVTYQDSNSALNTAAYLTPHTIHSNAQ